MHSVLVAEDSFALANLLEFVLKSSGFGVEVHRCGTSAYEAATARPFDLILLDQQMPGRTGIEVLESLRATGPNLLTPTFLCTAKCHELDLQYLQAALNLSGVFHKPFSPKDLVRTFQSTLQSATC